ncbi:hypothetical protein K2173_022765 [Erythroxylum novogranatense]|uniref:DDT domain-containing protein DDR4 n=1 Tax=Erythroxylum novogranatense TaxID=1862640 RepID=A0AAV8SNJ1_9ROSI|nr:hypothetical protein K2173_022765 [Erythroxylum novogranatense]
MTLLGSSSSSPIPQNDAVDSDKDATPIPNHAGDSAQPAGDTPAPAPTPPENRTSRLSRACTVRTSARLYAAQQQAANERKQKPKEQRQRQQRIDESSPQKEQCGSSGKIITPLVGLPEPAQLPRWNLRSMWELASILNFLHVFRPLLNIQVEFSAEEFETSLLTPNDTLGDIHMPLLKAIPPITRMALTQDTWITVLCRKLRDWWYWVADGELPIIASHGLEIEAYKTLDPAVRVVILKALCDIRTEQEDIKNYMDNSLKHGIQLSMFRKERVGGDSQGINYWYEDDPMIGHRLYREIRKVEGKKAKTKGSQVLPSTTYLWETVATNLEEFQDVSEKLFESRNRTEASLGKKLKNDMLPEIAKVHKRKEKLLKKQHRQALLLDNFLNMGGLAVGRSLRDRKPVTYTFDDYDRSISEAIKVTKRKPPSPEPIQRRDEVARPEAITNGRWSGPSHTSPHGTFSMTSPNSPEYDDFGEDHMLDPLDRSNRRRQRPQRYSAKEYVEAVSDNDADFYSDDDIVGEAVYDEEYTRKRKQRKLSSSSEGDEEYQWDEENGEDEEEEEEDSLSISEESDGPQKIKKLPGRTRREFKLRSVDEIQSGLRRSKRATRNRINYRQYELSESEAELIKPEKSNASDERSSDASEDTEYSAESQDSDGIYDDQDMKISLPADGCTEAAEKQQIQPLEKSNSLDQDQDQDQGEGEYEGEGEGVRKRRLLDLNEVAPGSGFDDGPNATINDDDRDDF